MSGIINKSNYILENGLAIRTNTNASDAFFLQAYDVDGSAYKTFATLTAGNTPSFALAAPSGGTLTIDGATIGGTTPGAGTFTSITTTGGLFPAGQVEIGVNGSAIPTYIDFHPGTTSSDYDARIQAWGGNGTTGGGSLALMATGVGINNNGPAYALDVNGSARIGSEILSAPSNGLVLGGDLNIGDIGSDANGDPELVFRRLNIGTSDDNTVAYFNATGSGDGDGAIHMTTLWDDVSLFYYTKISSVDAYRKGHQFYVDKSILMMPTSASYDSDMPYGTQAFGRNGANTTSYASWYSYVDQTNHKLKFRVRYTDGTLKTGEIALS